MTPRSEHNEGREPIMRDVQQVLRALREGNRENPDVLAIDGHNVMLALNKGFPKHMYHWSLDPVVALDKQDERGLIELGYQATYIPREFPCYIHRRNFSPRFALATDPITRMPQTDKLEFIESRIVKTKADYDIAMRQPAPPMPMGIPKPGPWVKTVTEIPPIEAESDEDKILTIARLEGALAEARQAAAPESTEETPAPKRRGRKPGSKKKLADLEVVAQ
jgi:hypothetical protein